MELVTANARNVMKRVCTGVLYVEFYRVFLISNA